MAAEVFVSPTVDLLLGKLGSFAYQQVCLMYGVEKDLEKLKKTLTTIKKGLIDAEKQQLDNSQVGDWLEELKEVCYDAEDVFDEFEAEALRRQVLAERGSIPKKVCNALSWPKSLAFRFNIGHKIKELRERLNAIAENQTKFGFKTIVENRINYIPRQRETHSYVVASEIIGREKDKEDVIELLMDSPDDTNVSVIPIVGIAGLGKTALAKLVYNDRRINECFDLKLWICVSDDFVEKNIMIDIIKSATGQKHNDMSLDQLQKEMRGVLDGKKYLLVMDDVWNDDVNVNKWNEFKNLLLGGTNGSKILVTTRSGQVASVMGTMKGARARTGYQIEGLPYGDCLSLFMKCVFKKEEEEKFPNLVKIGGEIVKKCGGVPLAVKTLGSLLYSSYDEYHWKDVKESELWNLEQKEDGILPALKLSYDHLPSYLKQCFVYCSTSLKDFEFTSYDVVGFWMAQGLLESRKENEELEKIGMQYLKELLSGSFFQDFEEILGDYILTFKMHDLMHDLALSMAKNECGIVDSHNHFICKKTRHLSFVEENMIRDGVPSFLSNTCHLRSICFPVSSVAATQSFVESCISMFPFLRCLDLSYGSFVLVPKKLGNLRHLRYLNL
ncbi:hypothetical protein Ddye_009072 [Dipteronia dyeriana]|uniref:Disease resistance protein RGA3 n=1 Tax=Dipteronia dyeriana TaxID=168575 RepID=A0AAE0CLX2_9ROSI|nr:hypothetical protein Ddye_009072 [Dipteronia dyeriana]